MNNKLLLHILATLLCILSLTACNRADEWEATGGDTGLLVTLTDGTHGVETRATPQELREQLGDKFLQQFRLTITHLAGEQEVHDSIPYDTELIRVPAGFYDVEAKFGDNPTLALDAPYYTGRTEDVEVKGHQQKPVSIACSVANALLSVKYENVDKLDEKFTNYYVSVHVGKDSVNIKDTAKSAYFRADTTSLQLFFHYDDGKSQQIKSDAIPTTFEAGDHLILTLRMSPTMTMEIAKAEIKQVTVKETIPETWLPKPKIEAAGFADNRLSFAETEKKEATLRLNTALGLQDLKLTFNFEDEKFSSLNGKEYLLSNAEDKSTVQQVLGISLPDTAATNASIDLSPLIAKMQTKAGETVTNTLTLDVKANGRWSSEDTEANRTYTMVCNKPEFSIAVQPGNVWTKQFTIDEVTVTAGDAETIKGQLQYQYKAEGSEEWVNSDQLLVSWDEAPATKKYQVRAVYRDEISTEEIDVELETPVQLPNGNMDAWTESIKEITYGWSTYDQPFFEPWINNQVEAWWDSNNHASMPNPLPSASNESYKCFPTTTFLTPDRGGTGKAAVIRTVNANGFWSSSVAVSGTDFRGILYAGTTSTDGTMNEGRPWRSRPTGLSFYYKYNSYDNERFGVYIDLYADQTLIASGSYMSPNGNSTTEFTLNTIQLAYSNETLKPTSIRIRFCSVADGDDPAVNKNIEVNVPEGSSAKYHIHGGSVLYIDDISLIYDK